MPRSHKSLHAPSPNATTTTPRLSGWLTCLLRDFRGPCDFIFESEIDAVRAFGGGAADAVPLHGGAEARQGHKGGVQVHDQLVQLVDGVVDVHREGFELLVALVVVVVVELSRLILQRRLVSEGVFRRSGARWFPGLAGFGQIAPLLVPWVNLRFVSILGHVDELLRGDHLLLADPGLRGVAPLPVDVLLARGGAAGIRRTHGVAPGGGTASSGLGVGPFILLHRGWGGVVVAMAVVLLSPGTPKAIGQKRVLTALVAGRRQSPQTVHAAQVVTCGDLIIQDVRFPLSGPGVSVNVHLGRDYLLDADSGASVLHVFNRWALEPEATQQALQLDLFLLAGAWVLLEGPGGCRGSDDRRGFVRPQGSARQARVTADREGVVAVVRAGGGRGRAGASTKRALASTGALLARHFVLG